MTLSIPITPLKPIYNLKNQADREKFAQKQPLRLTLHYKADSPPRRKIFNHAAHLLPGPACPYLAPTLLLTHNSPHFIVCPLQSEWLSILGVWHERNNFFN
jgi:hypothetical protein